ncbi:MAG: histidine triad nucleotide-binding protein [Clostridia bacterium]|nr:histidine triad nucleotide-binding protein [Clostridia bacterium]
MENCLFCKIIEGEIPSQKVYEDDEILAFKDINPKAKVHILVIPKKHIESLKEISVEDEKLIFKMHQVLNVIAKEQGLEDYNLVVNCGKGAGQEVMHLHFHLLGNP